MTDKSIVPEYIHDYIFKIVVIGDSAVGKTSILSRYCDDKFNDKHMTTLGVDFKIRTLTVNDKRVKLQIWDTAGQERWADLSRNYYKGALGVVYVFALDNLKSFNRMEQWMESTASFNIPYPILVGSKCDLKDKRVVQRQAIRDFCSSHGQLEYVETSARMGENISEMFNIMTAGILEVINEAKLELDSNIDFTVLDDGVDMLKKETVEKKACFC